MPPEISDAEVGEDLDLEVDAPEDELLGSEEPEEAEELTAEDEVSEPVPAAPPAPAMANISSESIQQLLEGFKGAIQPLVPQPKPEPQAWDSDDGIKKMMSNHGSFREGMAKWLDHHTTQKTQKLEATIQNMGKVITALWARSQQRPDFQQVDETAQYFAKQYGVPYHQAVMMAQDPRFKQQAAAAPAAGAKVKTPPKHAAMPGARANTELPAPKSSKSVSTKFADILKEPDVRAARKLRK